MKKLTTNKDIAEMTMTELAHNCCYAKDGKARYRDYDLDIDVRDFIRKIAVKLNVFENGCAELIDDESFDETLIEYLQYVSDTEEGLIAIFYRNLWAMADLRERLKEYEDIGLLPEQIIEVDSLYAEKCKELARIYAELKKYKEYCCLEEQRRLLKLPCAVGDTVYVIPSKTNYKLNIINGYSKNNRVYEQVVNRIEISGNGYLLATCDEMASVIDVFYKKTWFLTREEAENALKEMSEWEGKSYECKRNS